MAPDRREGVKKKIRYAIDALPSGDRIVRSVGLEEIGQREIGALVLAHLSHEADHEVMGLLQDPYKWRPPS